MFLSFALTQFRNSTPRAATVLLAIATSPGGGHYEKRSLPWGPLASFHMLFSFFSW